ncbi:sulfatase family protein [Ulvibacterium marinum]|uniref:sulfatase family protein n=1 Tax=Ulvibacterium marinum TaxID=2419782 RepID=UPI0024954EF5|nr:arylsulfatase [Ulvibacterium marinum]
MNENSKYRLILSKLFLLMGFFFICSCQEKGRQQEKRKQTVTLPNVVIILADDLGYGDLGSYNKNSLVPTPNLDKLASQGIRLTDAYCPVAACSPSRYALMTGSYPFRSWKKTGVLANYEPSMMAKGQLTLPQMLQNAGYTTAGFGKWHLGASFPTLDGEKPASYGKHRAPDNGANLDLSKLITDGPVDHGFEHWYGFSCASECWIMDEKEIVAALQHDFYNIASAQNKDHIEIVPSDEYLDRITTKSTQFLQRHTQADKDQPFFLYFAPYVPHVPLAASKEFQGTTKAGLYGDYVYELDTYIGKLLDTLDSLQLAENTVVLFASDNGSHFEITRSDIDLTTTTNSAESIPKKDQYDSGHYPNGVLRGTKRTAWEGGVRTPFIARWPGHFPKNTKSTQLFALNDVIATLASIISYDLPVDMAVDSYDQLSVLEGKDESLRKSVVVQSSGNRYGVRRGDWKYIEPTGEDDNGELYNLKDDVSESKNRYKEHPELAQELKEHLNAIQKSEASNMDANP